MTLQASSVKSDTVVRIAHSTTQSARAAAGEVMAALDPRSLAGALLFCSSRYAVDQIAAEIAKLAPGLPVVGCTTAGEITPTGALDGALVGVGLPASDFAFQALAFDDLDNFDPVAAHRALTKLAAGVNAQAATLGPRLDRAAILLIDGLSRREELLSHACQHILEDIPLVGGSAGDGRRFERTFLLHDGAFRSDRAVLAALASKRPLRPLRTQHHAPDPATAVVTRATPATRTIHELNGLPAAAEYARLLGLREAELSPRALALHPLMVRAGGQYFSRSVQQVRADGALVCESAIDLGIVLRLGRSAQIVERLLEGLHAGDTDIDCVLAFESAANRLEAEAAGLSGKLAAIYATHRFVGFNTYGEQFREVHMNRNLVGLAVGRRPLC
jgi:hypothetical protein